MKLKNKEIAILVNSGILDATSHSLPVAHNYKVYSLKKALKDAFKAYAEKEEGLLKEYGIGDPREFNAKLNALSIAKEPTEAELAELATMKEMADNYNKLHAELDKDEVEVPCKTIDYESWVALQRENCDKSKGIDIFNGAVEEILEEKFWLAPTE